MVGRSSQLTSKKATQPQVSSIESEKELSQSSTTDSEILRQLACRLEDARTLEGLGPTGSAMLVSAAFREWGGPQVWVCHDNRQAELFAENLRFFLPPDRASSVLIFPGIEANPYLGLSPHPEI